MNKDKEVQAQQTSLRGTINEITERLIGELQEEPLTPQEKIAFLRTLLPYTVGRLPTAAVNYQIWRGQPTTARIIEPTSEGGQFPDYNQW